MVTIQDTEPFNIRRIKESKCHWFYELPLASASGLKGRLQIGFSRIIM